MTKKEELYKSLTIKLTLCLYKLTLNKRSIQVFDDTFHAASVFTLIKVRTTGLSPKNFQSGSRSKENTGVRAFQICENKYKKRSPIFSVQKELQYLASGKAGGFGLLPELQQKLFPEPNVLARIGFGPEMNGVFPQKSALLNERLAFKALASINNNQK